MNDEGDSWEEEITRQARESADVAAGLDSSVVSTVALRVTSSLRQGKKVVLFGNGGSAAQAIHIAAELVGRYDLDRRSLPALALSSNISSLTALGNDYGYETIFEKQVEAFVQEGDVVIGMSTSGNSPNVLRGIEKAKSLGAYTVGFTGKGPNGLTDLAEICLCINSTYIPRIQESHLLAGHIMSYLVERALFGSEGQ